MKAVRRTSDEQYELIMECRTSGLSDYQWCTDHGINPGTFYNWVKRLRKKPVMTFRRQPCMHAVPFLKHRKW